MDKSASACVGVAPCDAGPESHRSVHLAAADAGIVAAHRVLVTGQQPAAGSKGALADQQVVLVLDVMDDRFNWFTEGFDTADLKDAKSLLGELGA